MASEIYFRNTFCQEIIAAFSKERFTNARMQAVWGAVKLYPDEALVMALKEITKPALFPGADKIIEACAKANAELKALEISRAKASGECSFCSNGLRQVNNFSYRCTCKLGQLMFPSFPEYDGQVAWVEKRYTDENGNEVLETKTHIYRNKPGSRDIRDFSFTVKQSAHPVPTKDFNKPMLVKFDPERF